MAKTTRAGTLDKTKVRVGKQCRNFEGKLMYLGISYILGEAEQFFFLGGGFPLPPHPLDKTLVSVQQRDMLCYFTFSTSTQVYYGKIM